MALLGGTGYVAKNWIDKNLINNANDNPQALVKSYNTSQYKDDHNLSSSQSYSPTQVVTFSPNEESITSISTAPVFQYQDVINDLKSINNHFNQFSKNDKKWGHIEGKKIGSPDYRKTIEKALSILGERNESGTEWEFLTDVKKFQKENDLKVDYDAGPETIKKMIEKLKELG